MCITFYYILLHQLGKQKLLRGFASFLEVEGRYRHKLLITLMITIKP